MTDIVASTRSYERWLASQTPVVAADLRLKHERMDESAFVFLRATFYRWVEQWPAVCAGIADAPRVLAVGDLHVENFGTWRDIEGRLVWGVNDVDEAASLPYTSDLTRLAASALLAINRRRFRLPARAACDAILAGYTASLACGGRPIVLAERRRWLRLIALNDLRDPAEFWDRMQALPRAGGSAPRAVLAGAIGQPQHSFTIRRRVAGVGSLGRPRFVALAERDGGWIAREAKAFVPSAVVHAGSPSQTDPCERILGSAVRNRDPYFAVRDGWIVRRLAPDCSRVELADMPDDRDEAKLLRAMGWETANLHLGSRNVERAGRDVRSRNARWLRRAADKMAAAIENDWRAWRARGRTRRA